MNWKDVFAFNSSQRNGILVLISLIFFTLAVDYVIVHFIDNHPVVEVEYFQSTSGFNVQNESRMALGDSLSRGAQNKIIEPTQNSKLFYPDTATKDDWISTGLSEKQVQVIEKYKANGGRILSKKNLLKLYVISDKWMVENEFRLQFPEVSHASNEQKEIKKVPAIPLSKKKPKVQLLPIELNSADTTVLKSIKGIGSYYANAIVKYRSKLGGFYQWEQLFEVPNMREETVLAVEEAVTIDTLLIHKININSASAGDMVKHPYITWNMAKNIYDYRVFKKKYKALEELISLGLLDEELYSKLVPYLEI